MQNKLLTMLGFAIKSGNLVSGENTVEIFMPKRKVSLLIIAEDASENTKDKFVSMAERYNVPYLIYGTREELSHAIGKFNRTVIGLTNKKFSREIKRIHESF